MIWRISRQEKIAVTILKKAHQKRRYFLGALTSLYFTAGWAAEPRKLVLLIAESNATNTPQVPYNPMFQQAVAYVEKELHLQFEYRRYPWKRLLQSLNEGEGLAFGLSKTRERAQTLHFSLPAFATHVWLVVRSDQAFAFSRLADLQGKTVGMVRGSTYGDEFEKAKLEINNAYHKLGLIFGMTSFEDIPDDDFDPKSWSRSMAITVGNVTLKLLKTFVKIEETNKFKSLHLMMNIHLGILRDELGDQTLFNW